jgi:hypothetical protein
MRDSVLFRVGDRVIFWDDKQHCSIEATVAKTHKKDCKSYDLKVGNEIKRIQKSFISRKKRGGQRPRYKNLPNEVLSKKKSSVNRQMPRRMPALKAVQFSAPGQYGDYRYMSDLPNFLEDAILVYNDNVTQFLSRSNSPGGGNACIRPLRSQGHAVGIPTGDYSCGGGFNGLYQVLNLHNGKTAKALIDMAIDELDALILNNPQKRLVFYSSDSSGIRIGSGIFSISDDVLDYITHKLRSLPLRVYRLL